MSAKDFTFAEITEVLLKLRENKGSRNKTGREFQIAPDTIKRWEQRYGEEVWAARPIVLSSYDAQIKKELHEENKPVRKVAMMTAEKALKLLNERIDDGLISSKDLIEVFKATAPYVLPRFDEEDGKKSGKVSVEHNYTMFVQNVYNKLNNGNKVIEIEGHTEKPPGRK